MFKKSVLVLLAVVFGLAVYPWEDNPMRYVHWADRFKAVPLGEFMLGTPCSTERRSYNSSIVSIDENEQYNGPKCLIYTPSRMYRGVWSDGFESQDFVEFATKPYSDKLYWKLIASQEPNWMYISDHQLMGHEINYPRYSFHRYLIEFNGRRTLLADSYGHMGSSKHQMWIDEIISIEALPPMKLEEIPNYKEMPFLNQPAK